MKRADSPSGLVALLALTILACDGKDKGPKNTYQPPADCEDGASCEGCGCRSPLYCNPDDVCTAKSAVGDVCERGGECATAICKKEMCVERTELFAPCDSCSGCDQCVGMGASGICSRACVINTDEYGLVRTGDSCAMGNHCVDKLCWPICDANDDCKDTSGTCDFSQTRNSLGPGIGVCMPKVRTLLADSEDCPVTGRSGPIDASGSGEHHYTAVAPGSTTSCGVRDDGTVLCGGPPLPQSLASQRLKTLDIDGYEAACGITLSDTLVCASLLSSDVYRLADVPAGTFKAVSVEPNYACALSTAGAVDCWGGGTYKPADPSGSYSAIATNDDGFCGIVAGTGTSGGTIRCELRSSPTIPSGKFISIAGGGQLWCAVETGGRAQCWGRNDTLAKVYLNPDAGTPPTFKKIAVGEFLGATPYVCGITPADQIKCLGGSGDNVPSGSFKEVRLNHDNACAISLADELTCWRLGGGMSTVMPPPP